MREDVARWNLKYGALTLEKEPDTTLISVRQKLRAEGLAIDVACGGGANTHFISDCGYEVVGLDCSFEALRKAKLLASYRLVSFVVADVDDFVWPTSVFMLVSVVKFLNRRLFNSLAESVKPGGQLFYKTFNARHLINNPRFSPDYVLRLGELVDWLYDWDIQETNDLPDNIESFSYILAKKPKDYEKAAIPVCERPRISA